MSVMQILLGALAVLLCVEKLWRVGLVVRFFRRPTLPVLEPAPRLVSILQPILSGDPTLALNLEENVQVRTAHIIEFWYLLDTTDTEAIRICRDLEARFPERVGGILLLPPPPDGVSPKMFKLAAGQDIAQGDIVCCLDDDTVLPDNAFEICLPHLAHAGLVFGLPFYLHFGNIWSAYVSCFVNASSLLTYIPYTALCDPFTINGMFFAVRRETLNAVGGFGAAQDILADDFGTAHLFCKHGFRLAQSPLRHGIRTHVRDFAHLRGLLGRWFTFPRESLLRHLSLFERGVVLLMGVTANFLPVVLVVGALALLSSKTIAALGLFFLVALTIILFLNRVYLRGVTPPWALFLMPLVLLIFPLQMLAALLAPSQRVNWRGHIMEAKRGGGFRFITRR